MGFCPTRLYYHTLLYHHNLPYHHTLLYHFGYYTTILSYTTIAHYTAILLHHAILYCILVPSAVHIIHYHTISFTHMILPYTEVKGGGGELLSA